MILQDHICVSIRTSRCYDLFNNLQLVLTSTILFMCYSSNLSSISLLEIVVAFCLGLDLMIRNFSQSQFLKNRCNLYDFVLMMIMIASMVMHQMKGQMGQFTNASRYLSFGVIVLRYSSQLIRFGLLLLKFRQNSNIRRLEQIRFDESQRQRGQFEDGMVSDQLSFHKQIWS